jgi:hypothetical protein
MRMLAEISLIGVAVGLIGIFGSMMYEFGRYRGEKDARRSVEMIPPEVRSYWNAQEWLVFHVGLPLFGICCAILLGIAWLEHRDDMNVNDDSPLKPTKILDL